MPAADPQTLVIALSLAIATLVSEDLTCIAAGALVAGGQIGFLPATAACFAGIAVGDLLLFLAGRVVGRRLLDWGIVRKRVSAHALERSTAWFQRRGFFVVLLTRFLPGTRLPTYLAAGMLRTSVARFTAWFLLAAALWTPLLVGTSAFVGTELTQSGLAAGRELVIRMLIGAVLVGATLWVLRRLQSWPGRRRAYGMWRRVTRWEFWPAWMVYPPVVAYIVLIGLKHRCLTVFTAANPGIPAGGFIGESKFQILQGLSGAGGYVARAARLPASVAAEGRLWLVDQFMAHAGLSLPIVLKPDQGQRGTGVTIARTSGEVASRVSAARGDLIVQEYVAGSEFGVFYYRHPSQPHGRILSITEKRFPRLVGDGVRTLEELILADDRAVCQERVHRETHKDRLHRIPGRGERIRLVEVGSHCRGSLFIDAAHLWTRDLEDAFDRIAWHFDGFYFGRFDVRTPSVEDFRAGRNFKILELNGVTSEATHIYDPSKSLLDAYRSLFEQWRLACEIGAANARRGAMTVSLSGLVSMVLRYRRSAALDVTETRAVSTNLEVTS
jgi:membrane protein DedA with SNARE-associated domain